MFCFHMLILDVFFLTAGLACLPASWPLSLLPSLAHSLSSLQDSLQVKKVMIFSPLYNFPQAHNLDILLKVSATQVCFKTVLF